MTVPDAERLWGGGDIEVHFIGHQEIVVPWPRLSSTKSGPKTPSALLFFAEAPSLRYLDPRQLWSTQSWVLRNHVSYYLTGEWERSGRTSADQNKLANRYPLVVADSNGRMAILAGHHRSAAALIEGRELLVRWVPSEAFLTGAVAILPHLLVCETAEETVNDAVTAAQRIADGDIVVVSTAALADATMRQLGLSEAEISDRLTVARLRT